MKVEKIVLLIVVSLSLSTCGVRSKKVPKGGMNVFSVEKDVELGKQVSREIESKPSEYPILDSASNVAAYKYIYMVRDKILETGKVKYKDKFAWRVRIIDDDNTLNAFATPGGYIYFYTGLIKYLDNEAEFAGVMGHEIAHADLRHSTHQMTKTYGIQILISALLGNSSSLGQITSGLLTLKFSRKHESESDRLSVEYLCATDYIGYGGAGFFEKIKASGSQTPPQFISTHPSPENRIENYHTWAKELNCGGESLYEERYAKFKQLFD